MMVTNWKVHPENDAGSFIIYSFNWLIPVGRLGGISCSIMSRITGHKAHNSHPNAESNILNLWRWNRGGTALRIHLNTWKHFLKLLWSFLWVNFTFNLSRTLLRFSEYFFLFTRSLTRNTTHDNISLKFKSNVHTHSGEHLHYRRGAKMKEKEN